MVRSPLLKVDKAASALYTFLFLFSVVLALVFLFVLPSKDIALFA